MERKLIRFAKAHGYLTVAFMLCLEILLIVFMGSCSYSTHAFVLFVLLWTFSTVLVSMGLIQEDFRCLKHAKLMYIILSIAGFMLFGPILGNNVIVISTVILYVFCVLHFLQKLFEDLKKIQDSSSILTTIVYGGNQPVAAAPLEQSQPVQNQSPESLPPPSYETAVSMYNSFEQPKQSPTWM